MGSGMASRETRSAHIAGQVSLESGTVESVRDRYDAYGRARERAAYLEHSARGVLPADLIEGEFADVCSGDALAELRREREAASFESGKLGWTRLAFHVESAVLDTQTRALAARVAQAKAQGASAEQLAGLREERFVRLGELREKLGHASGRARSEARLPGVDWELWGARAERFLVATEGVYADAFGQVLPRLGVDAGAASARDEIWIDHLGRRFDALFREDLLWECAERALESMGLSLARCPGLRVDDEPLAERQPSTERFALRVPGEVVVSAGLRLGPSAYASGFFALGRALPLCFASSELPVERRRPFDRALDRAFGWLLSDLWADSLWIDDFPAGRARDALARSLRFRQLFARRRCAGLAPAALALAALGGGADPRRVSARYVEGVRRATGLAAPETDYLERLDAELSALDELRGRALAAQLAEHLRQRFGRRFWRERASGALLKELWNTGSTYTAESLAAELALGPLDVEIAIQDTLRAASAAR
jgi:hypothetical protein